MGMPPRDITAEELATWLTPHHALSLVVQAYGDSISVEGAIIQRLSGGMIHAVAGHAAWDHNDLRKTGVAIPSIYWVQYARIHHEDFWQTSDIRLYISNIDGRYNSGHIAYFGVRFEPEGVRELLASAPKKSATGPEQQEPEDEDQGQKGPPVSETHLRQWYALYRSVYHGPGDTMEMALRSARGMFPGKFVSRDAICKLAGGRTRGRKQRATET